MNQRYYLNQLIGSIGPKGPDDHGDWMLRIEPLRPVN